MRHGVVEGMAPLGTLPKVGIFKKTAAPAGPEDALQQNTPPPTRIVLKPRAKATTVPKPAPVPVTPAAQTEDDTEEVEDTEESEAGDDDEGEGLIAPPPLPTSRRRRPSRNYEDDDEWAPAAPNTISVGTRSINTRGSVSRASAGKPGSISQTSPSMQHTQTSASSVSRVMESIKDVADKVVEAAVEEAIKHYRYPTAWALRMLYDENSDNDEFLSMVQEVFTQTADAETVEQFARLLNAKKKDGKKGNKGFLYFIPPVTSNAPTPHKPKRAPYGNLVRLEVPQIGTDGDQTTSGKSPEHEHEEEPAREPTPEPAREQEPQKKKRKKLPEEPTPRADETPSKKRRKSSSKVSESATPAAKAVASSGKKKKKNGSTPATGNGKAKLTESPSMRRKARAASIASSSSTLSSARSLTPPDGIMDSDGDVDVTDVPPSRASPAAETSNNANAPTAPQPIARPKRNNAPKKKRNVAPTPPTPSSPAIIPTTTTKNNNNTTNTTTRSQQQSAAAATAASSMPALIEPPIFPNLQPPKKSAYKAAGAHQDKGIPVFPSRVGRLDDDDEKTLLRQKAKNVTNGPALPESYRRNTEDARAKQPHPERARLDAAARAGADAARSRPRSTRVSGAAFTEAVNGNLSAASRSTRSSRKRSHDEVDDEISPLTAHFPPGALDDASTAATSRAETPILRPAKRAKTGARVKQSPMKKKNGTSAGIPRPSGERTSPAPVGAVQDDNDDYCSSCGGNGELLCCDGCTRAFHLNCVDPPLFEDRMPADWFCNVCLGERHSFGRHSGAFRSLLERLDPKNSSAFRLPLVIRDYFEGVRTGVDGEYEPIVTVQKPSRKRKVEEEAPDFFRLRDNEGNSVICHQCNKPTADNRAIVPCSVCGLWWHIDCLDPPLAQPPVLRTWRCPAHVEDLLTKIPGVRGPAHRFRKIKGAADITPAYSRGIINNGWIEVIDEESEDESGYKDRNTFGRVQHLRGKGIKADFIYKVRKNRKGKPIPPLAAAHARAATLQVVDVLTVEKQQAALNLVQLSGQGTAGLDTLIDTLLANADPSMISLIARANPKHIDDVAKLNQSDEQGLRAVLAQLEVMQSQVKELLMYRGELPSPPRPKTTDEISEGHRRASTPARPFDALIANLPADDGLLDAAAAASESSKPKELPSPPATDLPDEKARHDSEHDVIAVASDSPTVEVKPEVEDDSMNID